MSSIAKYPRTQHIEGSRLQVGDSDLQQVPLCQLAGCRLVVEEKLDGANAGLGFDAEGSLQLQSRGHYLTGGRRERHFDLFKRWSQTHRQQFWSRLGSRYLVYGEWMYAKHTIFYDCLPHYFLEFDVLDRDRGEFLSTPARRALLEDLPVASVPVLAEGEFTSIEELRALIAPALYKSSGWRQCLVQSAAEQGVPAERVRAETDDSDLAEGLYLKAEQQGIVSGRFKFVRSSFLTAVVDSGEHWLNRRIVPNQLAGDVDLFAAGGG